MNPEKPWPHLHSLAAASAAAGKALVPRYRLKPHTAALASSCTAACDKPDRGMNILSSTFSGVQETLPKILSSLQYYDLRACVQVDSVSRSGQGGRQVARQQRRPQQPLCGHPAPGRRQRLRPRFPMVPRHGLRGRQCGLPERQAASRAHPFREQHVSGREQGSSGAACAQWLICTCDRCDIRHSDRLAPHV